MAIAGVLMARPRLLLPDEPSLGLSPLVVADVLEAIRKVSASSGITIVLVEQNLAQAMRISHTAPACWNWGASSPKARRMP